MGTQKSMGREGGEFRIISVEFGKCVGYTEGDAQGKVDIQV